MPIQRYEVTQPDIDTVLAWVASGEIAIPESSGPSSGRPPTSATCSTTPEVGIVYFVTRGTAPCCWIGAVANRGEA